jgi:hypothetical protein
VSDLQVTITFGGKTPDKAGQLAESLKKDMMALPDVSAEVRRDSPDPQDFGATLVLILAAPAVVVLANAVRDWARRTETGEIIINGNRVTNARSEDAAEIIRAIKGDSAKPKTPPGPKVHGKTSTQG